jgi:dTDP-4-amino-4,6-dideoxygalactose transaminase
MTGRELEYIAQAHQAARLSGDGQFTKRCHAWLEQNTGAAGVLLTHSCTAALEMAAILSDVGAGDEVIMPSFTFVSTANAFVLRGAVPVFVDIRPDTLNMDESLVERAITARTRAIVPVHYAGVACEMDGIQEIAERHGLMVIEDAAQGIMAKYRGKALGAIGELGALSFHETKNVISGEGGALLLRDREMLERAEIIREKGTNRSRFFRGQVDKYTWVDLGSSFLPSEITAAFLLAQLEHAEEITHSRLRLWRYYFEAFAGLEQDGWVSRPVVPANAEPNAHIFYLLLQTDALRDFVLHRLAHEGIGAIFHYIPLHSSPAGQRYARSAGALPVTESASARLIRLPLWVGMDDRIERVCQAVQQAVLDGARELGLAKRGVTTSFAQAVTR